MNFDGHGCFDLVLVRPEDVYKLPPLDDVAQCNLKMTRDDRIEVLLYMESCII